MSISNTYRRHRVAVRYLTSSRLLSAFSMVELLTCIGVILILAGLSAGYLSHSRFAAHIAKCTNNFRQLGVATSVYTGDDNRSRLPAFTLPVSTSTLSKYSSLQPTYVNFTLLSAMEKSGAVPEMWYCPTRHYWLTSNKIWRRLHGRTVSTISDMIQYFQEVEHASFAMLDTYWWVKRPLEGSEKLSYPESSTNISRTQTPWPLRSDQAESSSRPIASDVAYGAGLQPEGKCEQMWFGHAFRKEIKGSNLLFIDGSVLHHKSSSLKWELTVPNRSIGYVY